MNSDDINKYDENMNNSSSSSSSSSNNNNNSINNKNNNNTNNTNNNNDNMVPLDYISETDSVHDSDESESDNDDALPDFDCDECDMYAMQYRHRHFQQQQQLQHHHKLQHYHHPHDNTAIHTAVQLCEDHHTQRAVRLRRLRSINVSECPQVTDDGLRALAAVGSFPCHSDYVR
jgi:hypothetical protein